MEHVQQVQPIPNRSKFLMRVCVSSDDPQLQESPSEFDLDQDDEALYEDKFCKVTAKNIFVKWYYFPSGSSARLPLQSVSKMWIEPEGERFPSVQWGSSNGKIWWAFNNRRNATGSSCNVVVLEPRRPQLVGFSVRRRQRFLSALHSVARFPIELSFPTDCE